ncbi:uncharacterized protein [Lepeophtheirus salmonis]|uniref:uncharacterized protein isoform X1 n=1 Tax=Lepeophtheirus salmonis TaxID=72036 RepID=UPI001AE3EB6D|nr:BRCA2-interacting transcriptional repressor EMSY-like isoform X1 [Lepeophtheirus salmonis]
MWPQLLDLDPETCLGILRRLELEAYSSVVKALRAQGDLNKERRKILQDLGNALCIPIERHKAEMRRVANDELLGTIAQQTGASQDSSEWAKEGRRIIPLLRRARPLTSLTPKADEAKAALKLEDGGGILAPEKTSTKAPPSPLKNSKHPPPPSFESLFENGAPKFALPERPRLPEDIVLLPSGMAVRFRREGKGGPFTTQIIKPSPTTEPKKPSKKLVKRKVTPEPTPPKKFKPSTTSVSQAGHGYARPFIVAPSPITPIKKPTVTSTVSISSPATVYTSTLCAQTTTTTVTAIKPPPKVVLVADSSKTSVTSLETSSIISTKTSPPPIPKLPNNISKETVAKLIQSAPPGTRILPKPGSQQPIYVLAAPAGTNVATSLPSARILSAASNSGTTNNTRSIPRVVQVSGTPVRSTLTPPGAAPPQAIPSSIITGIQSTPTTIRTIQSSGAMRTFTTPRIPSTSNRHNSGKPSVIVVQRKTPPTSTAQNTLKTTTLTTKDLINKQARIYQTPKGGAKPVVIVSKPQSLSPSTISTTSVTATSNQNNVIVLDLSQEQIKNNSILTDILQASGILTEDGENKDTIHKKKKTTVLTTPGEMISSCPEIMIKKTNDSGGIISMDSSKIMIEKSGNSLISDLDNGLQKDKIKILTTLANNSVNFTQDMNDAIITIPETSRLVPLDKVPVDIEGVQTPVSPVETMEDITSFIEETNPSHHSGKEMAN